MYILDTSAIRSIKRSDLVSIRERHDLVVSTISVLELASHLHDSGEDSSFRRVRGNFLKCAVPRIIDDPFWVLSTKIGLPANKTRKEDADFLLQLIGLVEDHDSLGGLNNAVLISPDGLSAKCENIGMHISDFLQDEENLYIQQVKLFAEKLGFNVPKEADCLFTLSPDNLLSCISGIVNRLVEEPHTKVTAFNSAALYTGYIISRMYRYANARPNGTLDLSVDRNDCEDAYICLHLDLMQDYILVTNDNGTINALDQTMTCINSFLPEKIEKKFAISVSEFIAQTTT